MAKHIRALGLTGSVNYLRWCADKGFPPSLDKTADERDAEIALLRREAERSKARQHIHQNPRKFIEHACAGGIDPTEVARPGWKEAAQAIAASKRDAADRDSLRGFLLYLERRCDFLFEGVQWGRANLRYIDGLVRLHDRRGQWLRPIEDWRPETHNHRRQFGSLARHLLARYPVPPFLDSVWLRRDAGSHRFRDWFIHVGGGGNIRTADTLYPMTKRMAHEFMAAPDHYAIEEALLWADVRAFGGDQRLVETLLGTRLGAAIEKDDERRAFWASVYRFFIDNPMLDRRHVGPIIDFLNFQRFESHEVLTGPGQVEVMPPPQPGLSMNRRTPDTLLRQVHLWHGELRGFKLAANAYFRPAGFKGLLMDAGTADEDGRRARWRVRQLLSGAELVEEGRAMRHCVATYTASCARGDCSIWTLEREHSERRNEKHLTIALDRTGTMIEVRGRQNRYATEQERGVLGVWARRAGLSVGRFAHM